jgi:uncharacterized membrane protein YfcA
MSIEPNTALVLGVLFVSSFLRSAVGFGDALVAMPLLAVLIGVHTAAPLVALVAATLALCMLAAGWRSVRLAAAWQLIVGALAGIPLGLWLLQGAHDRILKGVLALVLVLYSGWALLRPRLPVLRSEAGAFWFGMAGGILGGAYNTNGPAVVIYSALRRWPPEVFRATLQSYFFPTGLLILAGHGVTGLWTTRVLSSYLLALPIVLAAVWLGHVAHRRIPAGRFDRAVYALLLLLGGMLLIQTLISA